MMPMFTSLSGWKPSRMNEHGDADVPEKLWADDMEVAVPKMPVLTKSDALKFARSGRMKFLSYRTSDIRCACMTMLLWSRDVCCELVQ